MKGVLLSINPDLCPLDLSHTIPPQDVRYTAFFLRPPSPTFHPDRFTLSSWTLASARIGLSSMSRSPASVCSYRITAAGQG